ncbi:hypothetical protein BXZ70DRAFT_902133, partial [Cristinia sonorae]
AIPMATNSAEAFLEFPFDADESYQQGLSGIIANGALEGKTDADREAILLRSRLFYYNRLTGGSLTPEDVQEYRKSHPPTTTFGLENNASELQSETVPPRTLSFAELKALIESGRTDQIPNNRHIPNDLHASAPSASTAPARQKPWERKQVDSS